MSHEISAVISRDHQLNALFGPIEFLVGHVDDVLVDGTSVVRDRKAYIDLTGKQDVITDLATIRSNATAGKSASDTIATYGNIVTHNANEFATAAQGAKADTAVQPAQIADMATKAWVGNLGFALIAESGNKFVLSYDNNNYKITGILKDKNNNVLSSESVTLNIGDTYVNATYDNTTKKFTFTQKDGTTKEVNLGLMLNGYATEQWVLAKGYITNADLAGYATKQWVEDKGYLVDDDLSPYSTTVEMNQAIAAHHDSTKQDVINDLDNIRSGAALGSTSIQPDDNISELTNDSGFITSNALQPYSTTSEMNAAIAAHHDNSKQDVISDLASIRGGADLGATSILPGDNISELTNDTGFITNSALLNYSTTAQMNQAISSHHDSTKQDLINDLGTIRTGAAKGATSVQPQDNVTSLTNDAGYITKEVNNLSNYSTTSAMNTAINNHHDSTKIDVSEKGVANGVAILNSDGYVVGVKTINNLTSAGDTTPLAAGQGKILNDRITNLESRGRYLAIWSCKDGYPTTEPADNPYYYKAGDYYIVGELAASGNNNYMPSGSTFTRSRSYVIETGNVQLNDYYLYDGTTWKRLGNTSKDVSFVNIAGDPYDNSELADALNDKSTVEVSGTGSATSEVNYITVDGTEYKLAGGQIDDVKVNGSSVVTDRVANIDLTGKLNIINSDNKLSSDLVDDTSSTSHKFVTSSEKLEWTNKQDALPTVVLDRYLHTNSVTGALEWAQATSGSGYESVAISDVANMGALREFINEINQAGRHCFFDFSNYISGAYVCTVLMYTQNDVNYCYIFDLLNHKIYGSLKGYVDSDSIQAYSTASENNNDIPYVLRVTNNTVTLQDIIDEIDRVNELGHHVFIDISAISTNDRMVTFSYTAKTSYTTVLVIGLIRGIIAAKEFANSDLAITTLVSLLNDSNGIMSMETGFSYKSELYQYGFGDGGYYMNGVHWLLSGTNMRGYDLKSGLTYTAILPKTSNGGNYNWTSMASNGSMFVVANTSGSFAYSTDARTWTLVSLNNSYSYSHVIANGDVFHIYNGSYYYYFTDPNNITYTTLSYPNWNLSEFSNIINKLVIVKANNATMYDHYGASHVLPEALTWTSVKECGGKLFLTASNTNKLYYSSDGSTWQYSTLPVTGNWKAVGYIPGYYLAVQERENSIYYSRDLVDWSVYSRTTTYYTNNIVCDRGYLFINTTSNSSYAPVYILDNDINIFGYNVNEYVAGAVANYIPKEIPTAGKIDQLLTKTTYGYEWKDRFDAGLKYDMYPYADSLATFSDTVYSICMAEHNGIILGASGTTELLKTTDEFSTYTTITVPSLASQITYGNGRFVYIGYHSCGYSLDNGETWTQGEYSGEVMNGGLGYCNGVFYNRSGLEMWYSLDGATWTACTKSSSLVWGSLPMYYNGVYYASAQYSRSGYESYHFYTSTDGIDWTIMTLSSLYETKTSALTFYTDETYIYVYQHHMLTTKDFVTWKKISISTSDLGYVTGGIQFIGRRMVLCKYDYTKTYPSTLLTFDNYEDLNHCIRYFSQLNSSDTLSLNLESYLPVLSVNNKILVCCKNYNNKGRIQIFNCNNTVTQQGIDVSNLILPNKENKSNKVTSIVSGATNEQYPSALAVYNSIAGIKGIKVLDTAPDNPDTGDVWIDTSVPGSDPDTILAAISAHNINPEAHGDIRSSINGKEDASNKVTSISGSSTDIQYPSAKAVYTGLSSKQDSLTSANAGANVTILDAGGHDLPAGYTELQYILSTGTLYINTGIFADDSTSINTSFTLSEKINAGYVLFGSRAGSGVNSYVFWSLLLSWDAVRCDYGGGLSTLGQTPSPVLNTKYSVSVRDKCFYVNNNLVDDFSGLSLEPTTYELYLGCLNTAGSAGFYHSGNIYETLISKNDVIVRNLIPAQRTSDSAVGMYDLVSNQFFTNASGTGAFIAGPGIVDSLTISATDTTYSDATTSMHGLMSVSDKSKLNGIAAGATATSVSDSGTATDEISYITINGTEKKIHSGETYTAGTGIDITNNAISNLISPLVPGLASSENQLADKAFVNSSVQTATANFRGNWATWTTVPTDGSLYPVDYAGGHTPTVNDYIAVEDASDYTTTGTPINIVTTGTGTSGAIKLTVDTIEHNITWQSVHNNRTLFDDTIYVYFNGSDWIITGKAIIVFNGTQYAVGDTIASWGVGLSVDYNMGTVGQTLSGTWRFKYTGTWSASGKGGWKPEYQINREPLTAAQIAALNSGATSTLIGKITTNESAINTHTQDTSNPHSVNKSQVGLGNVGNFKAVSTEASLGLSDTEKSNARANIGARVMAYVLEGGDV